MSKYELTIIVDANLADAEKESIHKNITDLIAKYKGKVINHQVWLEKHKMSFPIKKVSEATYYLFNIEIDGQSELPKLKRALQLIDDKVLRFLFIRQSEKKPATAAA